MLFTRFSPLTRQDQESSNFPGYDSLFFVCLQLSKYLILVHFLQLGAMNICHQLLDIYGISTSFSSHACVEKLTEVCRSCVWKHLSLLLIRQGICEFSPQVLCRVEYYWETLVFSLYIQTNTQGYIISMFSVE